jgi:acyl carrier protein
MTEQEKNKLNDLTAIFRLVFENERLEISMDSNTNNVEGWDSLSNIELIDRIEDLYGIEFPIEVIYEAESVRDWIDFILRTE